MAASLRLAGAAVIVPAWLFAIEGVIRPDGYLDPMTWHAHEMLVGYTAAVIAGFLLTAVGPVARIAVGWPLVALAFAAAASLPEAAVAALDLAFLPALAVAIGRPLVATRNRRCAGGHEASGFRPCPRGHEASGLRPCPRGHNSGHWAGPSRGHGKVSRRDVHSG